MASNLARFQQWAKSLVAGLVVPRRTEITIETSRVWVIRRQRSRCGWCQQCGREVELIGPEEAGAISEIVSPQTAGEIPARAWHICEQPDGTSMVCLESVRGSTGAGGQEKNSENADGKN